MKTPDLQYHRMLHADDRRKIIKAGVPSIFWRLRNRIRYRRWFPDAFVSADSIVDRKAEIGRGCVVRESVMDRSVHLGCFTTVANGSMLTGAGKIRIGRFCSIGPECFFRSENHNFHADSTYPFEQIFHGQSRDRLEYVPADIRIGHDVWIGARSVILAGAEIGHGSIVSAGAVVPAGSTPPYSILGGVPARVLKTRFTAEKIEKLLESAWWNQNEDRVFDQMLASQGETRK